MGFGRPRRRKAVPGEPPVSARAADWIATSLGFAAFLAWLAVAAPAVYVAWYCFARIGVEGFGAAWAASSIAAYFSHHLFSGWHCAAALTCTFGPDLVGLVASAALLALPLAAARLAHKRLTAVRNPVLDALPPPAGSNECGSARFISDPKELAEDLATCGGTEMDLERSGIAFGYTELSPMGSVVARDVATAAARFIPRLDPPPPPAGRYYITDEDEHVVIFGDTRAGKSRRVLMTSIDVCLRGLFESALIIDPKGELYGLLADALRRRGIKVNRIDFRFPRYSDRWNQMGQVVDAWDRSMRESDPVKRTELQTAASQLAQELVSMISPKEPNEGPAGYFNDGARAIIKSVVLYVASDRLCPPTQKTLTTVSRIIGSYVLPQPLPQNDKTAFIPYQAMLDKLPATHPAIEAFTAGRGGTAKETAQFCSTAQGMLQTYRDPAIAQMSATTDVPLDGLGRERSATFVIIPDEKVSYAGFANLYIQQTYAALTALASSEDGRLPYRVTVFGEEIGNIPPIPDLANKLGVGGGRGIRWVLALQNLPKLIEKYGRDATDDILGNCNTKILLKTGDVKTTAELFSKLLGDYTIAVEGGSVSGRRFAPIKGTSSSSLQLRGRNLLQPSEICTWNPSMGAIVVRNGRNYIVPLPDLSRTPTQGLFGLGDQEGNRAKMRRSLYGGDPPPREYEQPWYPELKQRRTYSDAELRKLRDAYLRELGFAYLRRLKRPKKVDEDAEPEGAEAPKGRKGTPPATRDGKASGTPQGSLFV